MEKEEYTQEMI